MDKKLIFAEGPNKYYRVSLPDNTSNSGNADFNKLLFFIGTYKQYRDREAIGSAYMAIRQKTNQILGLDWRNPILRTSKREVQAIRFYYQKTENRTTKLYVKIPFKVAYIFKAVAEIVKEIQDTKKVGIPAELQPLVDQTYLIAFYKEYAEAYDNSYNTIPLDMEAPRALNNDFHGTYSPLNAVFK